MRAVNLKKASEIARLAFETAKGVSIKTSVKVSSYGTTDVREQLEQQRADLLSQIDAPFSLLEVGFAIRDAVGLANATAGVTGLLTKVALIDAKIARLKEITGIPGFYHEENDFSAVAHQIAFQRHSRNSGSVLTMDASISVSLVDDAIEKEIETRIANLKLEKAELRDKLVAVNLNTTIDLDDHQIEVLRSASLIA